MKNIIFDIGNTCAKYAVFVEGNLSKYSVIECFSERWCVDVVVENGPVDGVFFSVTGKMSADMADKAKEYAKLVLVGGHKTKMPIENLYETKETLGFDRIAVCIGAKEIFPGKNILVVDAGTAITFDVVNSKGQYEGGLISPGMGMRFRALNEFTERLPLCKKNNEISLIGKNTNQAIEGGVINGIVNEIDGYINDLKEKYTDIEIILTGGDAIFFDKKLKNSIFVQSKLLMYGLNRILEYNYNAENL